MTELFLDGYRMEIEPDQIRQNFQNNKLGDVKDRQLNFTNTFKAFHTKRNADFFEHIDELNSQSVKPYRYMVAKIVEDGLEINTGTATIKKSTNSYVDIFIYSGINGIYESITSKSIRDLDWSALNHELTDAIAIASFDRSRDYIYGISNQSNKINRKAYLENWLPSVFEHVIFDMIFTQAGFTYEGEIFATDQFKAPVINPTTFPEDEVNFLNRDFSKFMPDIQQTEFLREILFRYGLMFDKVRNENKYVFKQIKTVLRDRTNADDWSSKFIENKSTTYSLGEYGKQNFFRYKEKDGYSKNADGFFEIDAENIKEQVTVATSIYEVVQKIDPFSLLNFPIFQYDNENNISIETIEPSISTIVFQDTSIQLNSDIGAGTLFTGDVPFLRFNDLNWSKFVLENYYELQKVADRTKVIDAELYLDPIDIYFLDFTKLKFIKPLSSYFYLNRISNFESGKTCDAELVRIPANVFSLEEAVNTAPIVDIEINQTIDQGETAEFTISVIDAENNVESYLITWGNGTSVSGFGLPPANIIKVYPNPGTYTVAVIVTDFEGLTGSDSVIVTVQDTFIVTFDPITGLYTAPAGSTVVVDVFAGGPGDCEGLVRAGTLNVGVGILGHNDLGSRQVAHNIVSSLWPSTAQFVFVMPANGMAWFKANHFVGPSGPASNFVGFTIKNNGDTKSASVTNSNPQIPV